MAEKRSDVYHLLFCVAKCKERVAPGLVIEILQGSHSVRLFNRRLNQNSAFGSMKGRSTDELEELVREAERDGLIAATEDEYPRLVLTERGREMLREHEE